MKRLLTILLLLGVGLPVYAQDQPSKPTGVTRQALERRLTDLKKGLEEAQKKQAQAQADMNAYGGAIQECEYWLQQAEQAEVEASKAKDATVQKPAPKGKK